MRTRIRTLVKALFLSAALVVVSGQATAQSPAAMPSGDEIANGTIALFDGETTYGWNNIGGADWQVADGALACKGGRGGGWLATTSKFGDFELDARVRVSNEASAGIAVRANLDGHPSENGTVVIPVNGLPKGESGDPKWQDIHVAAKGDTVTVTIDGKPAGDFKTTNAQGYIGVLYYNKGLVDVASAKLRPTTSVPLFDGKSLDGWDIIPDHKSKFSVVDGALNIKDGNGQIETKGLYKNFLLQLAIFSYGEPKPLNSGVFFRTPKGVFWKGYESQVRNEWVGDDRTKPVDFGSGGNYGNQPARKVVASEKEWFYKTVVAHSNHAAVWINGYLVSDFTDTRPVSGDANGKAGYVPEEGTINLQGHDPTTNLLFKNITIQEYK
jgi:hypothetical protein